MTPHTLFKRVVENNAGLHARYKNPRILPLEARPVLHDVLKLIAASPEPGIYRPDPELDGQDPLPSLIARSMDAVGAEQQVEVNLTKLARLGFFSITSTNCIVINNAGVRRRAGAAAGVTRAESNRQNGLLGGRPRRGESPEAYQARRQGSLMLPLDGGTGTAPYGNAVAGEELAQQLRSQIRLADSGDLETQETQPETQSETQPETQRQTDWVSDMGFVGSLQVAEEEEESEKLTAEEEGKNISPPPPPPRAGASAAETQTETQTHEPKPKPKPKPVSEISPAAARLAEVESRKWSWEPEVAKTAPRAFQNMLDEQWTIEQIDQVAAGPGQPRSPGFYRKALLSKFGSPGRRSHLVPQAPADTSRYPANLAGPWIEPIAKLHARLDKVFGSDYRSWMKDLRFIAFDDGELTLWSPLGFTRDHIRNNFAPQLATIIQTVCPQVRRLSFTSGTTELAKTG